VQKAHSEIIVNIQKLLILSLSSKVELEKTIEQTNAMIDKSQKSMDEVVNASEKF